MMIDASFARTLALGAVDGLREYYEAIKENILEGRYKAGDSLTENRIAEELNVSRTPVREAIRQLEFEDEFDRVILMSPRLA